jgi:hypothetical protein
MTAGLAMFFFVTPIIVSLGLFATWVFVWLIVSFISLGAFLLLRLELRYSLKSMLIAFGIIAPWSTIFFIPLPGDTQNLLAVLVALIGVLFYRHYRHRATGSATTFRSNQPLQKVGGALLVIMGLLLFYLIFPIALASDLLVAWFVSLPIFFVIFLGCSLILRAGFRKAAAWWLIFIIVTSLPWSIILPLSYQIIFLSLLGIILASVVLWYRRRGKSQKIGKEKKDFFKSSFLN